MAARLYWRINIVVVVFASFTCRLLAQFPLSVAIETSDAAAVVSTTVVDVAVQREWNCTARRRDS